MDKPFSPACERNRAPILAELRRLFSAPGRVLEIGSGTGQHAVHFAAALPHLVWQTSDRAPYHAGIRAWLGEAKLSNVLPPLLLDVSGTWPAGPYDGVFSANTCHIMGWTEVEAMFAGIGRVLAEDGLACIYGPFNIDGRFTSESNAHFDAALRADAPHMGIRELGDVNALAARNDLLPLHDIPMPANNRLLVWRKAASGR